VKKSQGGQVWGNLPGPHLTPHPSVAKAAKDKELEAEEELLDEADTRWFRSGAARANYLAMDRPDLSFATKELCRRMSAPVTADAAALRRVARYLADEPRLVYLFEWQMESEFNAFVDTDFAGCVKTRKSTSGGCAMMGSHLIKHWSTTQKVVTLSSGEAELAGIVKGTAEALGLQSLAVDLGCEVKVRVHADSAAAIGICKRSGIGRVRHLAVGQLWIQEKVRSGEITLLKVLGTENPADLLTKHLARDIVDQHLARLNIDRETGRAATAPKITASLLVEKQSDDYAKSRGTKCGESCQGSEGGGEWEKSLNLPKSNSERRVTFVN
jgi:hypothetical protein